MRSIRGVLGLLAVIGACGLWTPSRAQAQGFAQRQRFLQLVMQRRSLGPSPVRFAPLRTQVSRPLLAPFRAQASRPLSALFRTQASRPLLAPFRAQANTFLLPPRVLLRLERIAALLQFRLSRIQFLEERLSLLIPRGPRQALLIARRERQLNRLAAIVAGNLERVEQRLATPFGPGRPRNAFGL